MLPISKFDGMDESNTNTLTAHTHNFILIRLFSFAIDAAHVVVVVIVGSWFDL